MPLKREDATYGWSSSTSHPASIPAPEPKYVSSSVKGGNKKRKSEKKRKSNKKKINVKKTVRRR